MESVHFCSIPEYSEDLINPEIEATVRRMARAIEAGRQVRDRVKIPMKFPLSRVRLVDAEQKVLDGYTTLEKYIKEELNCMAMELDKDEDKYVLYSCKPDNTKLGQALKKQYNKEFKAKLDKLTNEQLKRYLAEGSIEVGGAVIQEGWLNVNKTFAPEFDAHEQWACHASIISSVMLDKV